ncbi:hypothetical protein [Actinacidiphila acidipaludis]|uniref:Uncharacterized protein n=1 Tax=Actinacidiphila acidipaludis TaxID=2873382 RepID=A0ABS7QA18_9ACTN|nr:hypothetical protein [Streptomyces acidipaludis]MBY8879998.1 hypothetical protein [Streptomyces acidipaludis]
MGRRHSPPPVVGGDRSLGHGPVHETVRARGRRGDRRWAIGCACAVLAMAMAAEADTGELGVLHALATCAVALVVAALLWPAKVTAGEGWLSVRGVLRTRRVRTDALVAVLLVGEIAAGLVLRDVHGGHAEIDPEVVVADPLLWHLLDTGVRRSLERGTLRTGRRVVAGLGRRVDDEAGAILRASGMR